MTINGNLSSSLNRRFVYILLFAVLCLSTLCFSEPVIMQGEAIKEFVGTPLKSIRLVDAAGKSIPFQIDEVTAGGEYVCDEGEQPNGNDGNGLLDLQDEIVFLWEDCLPPDSVTDTLQGNGKIKQVKVLRNGKVRILYICTDATLPLSKISYINYDHQSRLLKTPWYYAEFGKDRFHFVRAGVKNSFSDEYLDLTQELRVEIFLRVLWGLIPVRYSEDNMVCYVIRYKSGPLRLIRRGDFHLRLGLGVKGSRANVNQICYPNMVKVPVFLHAPIRFGTFLKEVYIEMTPVLNRIYKFKFAIPHAGFEKEIDKLSPNDSMIAKQPNNELMTISDGQRGYAWVLQAKIPDSLLDGSCFISRKPSARGGFADCGFKLTVDDLPKGYYEITNWVLFQTSTYATLKDDYNAIRYPLTIEIGKNRFSNRLVNLTQMDAVIKQKNSKKEGESKL